jgi:hypothetical protein
MDEWELSEHDDGDSNNYSDDNDDLDVDDNDKYEGHDVVDDADDYLRSK